jgi:hypothetical protein
MKKVFLTAAALLALLRSFSQTPDSTGFQSRKLKVDEINLVSSYYTQNGDHAAVTGGTGSEKLTDISNTFDIKLVRYDRRFRKHTVDAEIGVDHYTSASSDMIDLKANSSASHADTRFYPSVGWTVENEAKGRTFGAGVSYSSEFDYQSVGVNVSFSQKTKNKTGEFSAKIQTYLDQVTLITPTELRTNLRNDNYGTSSRNSFAGSLSYSQIINQRLQLMVIADAVEQNGFLSLPFHRVYFADGSVHQENLPASRTKLPLGFRANYFAGDKFIVRTYYRFYKDNWGLVSHTAEVEVPVKISPFISVSPFYRFYNQSGVKYFAAFQQHTAADQYYTSNYDLSKFSGQFVGAGVRITPEHGVFNIQQINMLELRFGHYLRSDGMNSNILSMNLKFK